MARLARVRIFVPDGHGGRRLSNGAFVLSLILLLGVGLGGVLVLSTKIQEQQTQLESLQDQAEQVSYHEAALQGQVDQLSTTNSLAGMAAALGMVPNTNPLIIVMPDGTAHGTPAPVTGTEMPGVASASASAPASTTLPSASSSDQATATAEPAGPDEGTGPAVTTGPAVSSAPTADDEAAG